MIAHTALNLAERGQAHSTNRALLLAIQARSKNAEMLPADSKASLLSALFEEAPGFLEMREGTGRCCAHGTGSHGQRLLRDAPGSRASLSGQLELLLFWERGTDCATLLIHCCFRISLCQKCLLLFGVPSPWVFGALLKFGKVCAA